MSYIFHVYLQSGNNVTINGYNVLHEGNISYSIKERLTIRLKQIGGNNSSLVGTTIIVRDSNWTSLLNTTWNSSDITIDIVPGTKYTIETGNINGFQKSKEKAQEEFVATVQNTKTIEILYVSSGVFIEDTYGNLYTRTNWTNSTNTKIANSIVVVSSNWALRLAVNTDYSWGITYADISRHITTDTAAKADFDWETNNSQLGLATATSGVLKTIREYNFPDGKPHNGHIGSGGEWNIIVSNIAEVKNCLSACGGTGFIETGGNSGFYFSSTCYGASSGNYYWYGISSQTNQFTGSFASWNGTVKVVGTF